MLKEKHESATYVDYVQESMSQNNRIGLGKWTSVKHCLAGAAAGVSGALVSCPFDVTRTLLQVQRASGHQPPKFYGILGTMYGVLAQHGVRGWYKGLGTTMMAIGPNWAMYFGTYNKLKDAACKRGYEEGPGVHICTAIAAGAATDVAVMPLWMVKTRLQTQMLHSTVPKYTSTFHAFRTIIKEEGFRALYQGLSPQLLGVVHLGIQFPLYELLKTKFSTQDDNKPLQLSVGGLIAASSISKAVASVVAYPHEVLRSRLQHQSKHDPQRYTGLWNAVKRIATEEGWKGFYRGMGANLLRVVPSTAVTFATYEFLVKVLESLFGGEDCMVV